MKSVLLFLAVILAPVIANAGYPVYHYHQPYYNYYEPQFFVAHNVVPAVVPHQNFIEKDGKVQQTVKTEIFAPVYLQRTEVIDYSNPYYIRKDVFLNKVHHHRGH